MIYKHTTLHTCPVCRQSKLRTQINWMQADTETTMHQFACRECLIEREAELKARPLTHEMQRVIMRLDTRLKGMIHA
jgi:hypothetical protein